MNLSERYKQKLEGNYQQNAESINFDGILVQLEVTNACNHKCVFCPNIDSKRKKQMIDYELAKRVISECAEFLGEDKKICFHMNGEPLLYDKLVDLIRYAKEKTYDYVFLTTNGSRAGNEILSELFDAGLDSIKFSINAGSRETYKKVHGLDDFDKAMEALRFSSEYRKKKNMNYKIYVSCVGINDNKDELEVFNKVASNYADEVVFYYPCAYAGQKIDKSKELRCELDSLDIKSFEIIHNYPCAVLWNSINITCEGYLSLCCSESDNRLIVEDINNKAIKEAWLGEKMSRIREKHKVGDIEDTPCFSCITESDYYEKNIDKELFELALKVQGEQ